jgi:hypothetical protein
VQLWSLTRPLSSPPMMHEWIWSMVEWYWHGKTEGLREKPIPVPRCPLQIPHGLPWARTRASAVRSRRLTPCHDLPFILMLLFTGWYRTRRPIHCDHYWSVVPPLLLLSSTGWKTRRSRFNPRQRRRDFSSSLCVQTSSKAHPASYPLGTGVFSWW